ncbi:MAG: hypothetical protein IPK53_11315 [bacterium]|nr:hypothetical protein [bacterium]
MVVDGQVGQEGIDLGCAHYGRMAFVMEEDITANPVEVLLFGAVGIVAQAENVSELIEQFR